MSALKKLMQARIKLQNTKLNKSGHNKFAGYKYFELGDFLPAIQAIFNDIGLCGVVSFGTEIATLTITDLDDGSEVSITSPMSTASLKGCHEVQNLGAVQTYLRRYLWVSAMEIVEHDAIDAVSGSDDKAESPKLKSKITPNDGALERLSEASQMDAKTDAETIINYWQEGEKDKALDVYNALRNGGKDGAQEYFLGVWEYLQPHSKIRNGLRDLFNSKKSIGGQK